MILKLHPKENAGVTLANSHFMMGWDFWTKLGVAFLGLGLVVPAQSATVGKMADCESQLSSPATLPKAFVAFG